MKNILVGLFVAAGFFAGSAVAATNNIDPANPKVTADAAGCELLGSEVTVNLSSNVKAAYSCSKDDNIIKFSACHIAGSRKIDTNKCVNGGDDANPAWNDSSCTSTDDTFKSGNFGKAFRATTAGGGVAAVSLTAICDDAAVKASVDVK